MNGSSAEHMRKQRKGDKLMGRHDKKIVKLSFEPMPDDFYKARINTLEKENVRLQEKVAELNKATGIAELAMDQHDEIHTGIVAELKEELACKDNEIEKLKYQIELLKEAVVAAALREV